VSAELVQAGNSLLCVVCVAAVVVVALAVALVVVLVVAVVVVVLCRLLIECGELRLCSFY
jgi:hypothetical protein